MNCQSSVDVMTLCDSAFLAILPADVNNLIRFRSNYPRGFARRLVAMRVSQHEIRMDQRGVGLDLVGDDDVLTARRARRRVAK